MNEFMKDEGLCFILIFSFVLSFIVHKLYSCPASFFLQLGCRKFLLEMCFLCHTILIKIQVFYCLNSIATSLIIISLSLVVSQVTSTFIHHCWDVQVITKSVWWIKFKMMWHLSDVWLLMSVVSAYPLPIVMNEWMFYTLIYYFIEFLMLLYERNENRVNYMIIEKILSFFIVLPECRQNMNGRILYYIFQERCSSMKTEPCKTLPFPFQTGLYCFPLTFLQKLEKTLIYSSFFVWLFFIQYNASTNLLYIFPRLVL